MDKTSLIYKKVKQEADEKFSSKTGIYKSSWIVAEYKKRGGIFKKEKPKTDTGLQRWYKEDWVRVNSKGKASNLPCGRNDKELDKNEPKGLCRPKKRVTKTTPKTIQELGPKELKQRYKQKKKNPDKIIK